MKRVVTKIGDIFEVRMDEGHKKYFQYIANDLMQLNSSVIRAFKKVYPISDNPDLTEIIKREVDFYVYCILRVGVKLNLWTKLCKLSNVGNLDDIIFRDTDDYGIKRGEESIKVSHKWFVWRINDQKFTYVGKLEGENRKAEIGLVFNPYSIIDRMQLGRYKTSYPDFE